MFGINKNKIKLSNLGMGAFEIENLFYGLNAEEQTFVTKHIIVYVAVGFTINESIKVAQSDLKLRNYLTR